ncbi:hypothetical protein [Lysinibacillus irui]|uniref:hypothetical protein n=1 Tax=Lysinibacillus irui TaxID=2998077 RepID=UPI002AD44446|nr:hypothetical protein [Lysinibacillus irui]MEA0565517.1 hypothetical protein [Lysinibacillus irui]
MFKSKRKEEDHFLDLDDRLIVYENDGHTCEIYYVTEVNDEAVIAAGRAVVPKGDCDVRTSSEGRVWLYNAPKKHVHEVERLAQLEKSMVLQKITDYKPEPKENPNLDMKFWALAALLFVAIIAAAF